METIFEKFDSTAGVVNVAGVPRLLERLAFLFLILMALTAPHSIAASQTSWLLGMVFWIGRFFFRPRPAFVRTFLFVPILALFGWTVLSSIFSYAPDISMGKLRSASLFLIFFFVVNNLRTRAAARFIAVALVSSCMISVLWMPVERLIGRGVEIKSVTPASPILRTKSKIGDAFLEANGKKVSTPGELVREIERAGTARIKFYRPDFYEFIELNKKDLLEGSKPEEKLGIASWKPGRNWRSAGFYGHYATYAEVIQLIASLTFGLLIAGFGFPNRPAIRDSGDLDDRSDPAPSSFARNLGITPPVIALFLFSVLMSFALLLTATRAPQAGLVVSALSLTWLGVGRKAFLVLLAIIIPLAVGGLIFLQQSRNVGLVDPSDNSTTWRMTVYREGLGLWTKNARNFTVGVGMDSIKRYKEEWHLFDDGRLPPSHFHSTPIQLVTERGLPALIFWLWMFGLFLRKILNALRKNDFTNMIDKGIVLGSFGGVVGFLISSLVHYNFGDGEVVMVLYLIMALSVASVTVRSTSGVLPDLQEQSSRGQS